MKIQLSTKVDGNYKNVMRKFDRKLFEALKPPIGEMKILEFTGSKKGDRVHVRFHSPVKAEWVSDITDDGADEKEAYFIDEGVQLPLPLSYWKRKSVCAVRYTMWVEDNLLNNVRTYGTYISSFIFLPILGT